MTTKAANIAMARDTSGYRRATAIAAVVVVSPKSNSQCLVLDPASITTQPQSPSHSATSMTSRRPRRTGSSGSFTRQDATSRDERSAMDESKGPLLPHGR